MKGTRFEAVSSIQQNVTRELKAIREETFSRCMNFVRKRAGTILSESIIHIFFTFFCAFLCPQFEDLIVILCIRG
jgi:hypothetical protein